MTTAIAARAASDGSIISVADLKNRANLLVDAMRQVMLPNVHYGSVDGQDRKFLWKAGAEKLQVLFGLSVECTVVESRVAPEEIYFRVSARCSDARGRVLSVQEGACSTGEDKYGWREAICEEEWESAEPHLRRKKFKKAKRGAEPPFFTVLQVRRDAGEQLNTILQMATKRASVACVRSATGASDIFALEEAGEEPPEEPVGKVAGEGDLRVTGARTKEGTSQSGKPYVLYFVKFSDGREGATFSKSFADLAEVAFRHNYAVKAVLSEDTKKPGNFKLDAFDMVAP